MDSRRENSLTATCLRNEEFSVEAPTCSSNVFLITINLQKSKQTMSSILKFCKIYYKSP